MPAPLRLDVEAKGDADDLVVMATQARAFKQELDALDGRKAKAKVELKIPNGAELASMKAQLDGIDGRTAKAKLQLSGPGAADVTRMTALKAALDDFDGRVARATVSITGAPSAGEVRQLRAAAKAVRELDGVSATTSVQFTGNLPDPKEIRAAARALKQLQDASPVTVVINVSGVAADIAAVVALARALRNLPSNTTARVNTDVDQSMLGRVASFGKALAGLGAAGGIAAAGAINATAAVATLAGSLGSLVGLTPLVVGGLAAGGVAAAALKVGLSGIGDALKESDPKKFAEALKGLSPEAATFARTVREIGPAWKSVQLDTQQSLMAGLGAETKKLSDAYLPSLGAGLPRVAAGFNGMAKDLVGFATSADTVRDVDQIFRNTGLAVEAARPGVVNLATAFRDVATVGSQELPELAAGWTNVTGRFQQFIAEARESGQLKVWIQDGISTLQTLGSIAGNVGTSLGAVFKAAKASGADFLTTLDRVTEKISTLLNSAQGQAALVAMFTEARAVVDALLPGLDAVARGALNMMQAFANTGGLQSAAQVLSQIGQTLGPLGTVIGQIAGDALGGLANAAGLAVSALSPLVGAAGGVLGALGPLPGLVLAAVVAFKAGAAASTLFAAGAARAAAASAYLAASTMPIPGLAAASAAAVGRAGTAMAAFGRALPGIAIALVALGAVAQATAIDFDGMAQKIGSGSMSFGQAVNQAFTEATTGFNGFMNWLEGDAPTHDSIVKEMGAAWDTYRASLGPMEQLQADVGRAQGELNDAVVRFGAESPQAAAAAAGLAQAQGRLKSAHDDAANAAKTQADRERELADTMRSQISTALQYAQAVKQTADAQKEADEAIKQHGANSAEAQAAVLNLAGAMASQAEAAKKQAEAWGGADAGMKAFNTELLKMATGSPAARAAFGQIASSLDATGLAALDAQARASGLKTEIMTLPDGRKVTVVVAAEAGKLPEVKQQLQDIATTPFVGKITIVSESENARGDIHQVVEFANGQRGTIHTYADGSPAIAEIAGVKYAIDATTGTLQVLSNVAPGQANFNGFKAVVDTSTGTMQLLANDAQGRTTLLTFQNAANGTSGMVTLNANGAPAEVVLNGTKYKIDATTGIMTIDGNPAPGEQDLSGLKVSVDRTTGTITILGKDGGVAALKATLSSPTSSTHTIYVKRVDQSGPISGTISPANRAGGGIVGYSGGGIASGRDRSPAWVRRQVIHRAARGMVLPGYAPGRDTELSWLSRGESVIVPEGTRYLGGNLVMAFNREMSGGRPGTNTGRVASLMQGAIGQNPVQARLTAAAGPRSSGGTTIVQPPNLGPLKAELQGLRGEIAALAASARSITVEDRSGDPAETARRTQLALRL